MFVCVCVCVCVCARVRSRSEECEYKCTILNCVIDNLCYYLFIEEAHDI